MRSVSHFGRRQRLRSVRLHGLDEMVDDPAQRPLAALVPQLRMRRDPQRQHLGQSTDARPRFLKIQFRVTRPVGIDCHASSAPGIGHGRNTGDSTLDLSDMVDQMIDDAPWSHIIYRQSVMAGSASLKDFVMTGRYDMNFRSVWLDR